MALSQRESFELKSVTHEQFYDENFVLNSTDYNWQVAFGLFDSSKMEVVIDFEDYGTLTVFDVKWTGNQKVVEPIPKR